MTALDIKLRILAIGFGIMLLFAPAAFMRAVRQNESFQTWLFFVTAIAVGTAVGFSLFFALYKVLQHFV